MPSLTLTDTTTVSPGLNEGRSVLICFDSNASKIWADDFSTVDILGVASSATTSSATTSSAGASSATTSSAGASSAASY